ncbi:MAG: hypothetical protein ABIR15_03185 [Chitinophagaceae bacterium]
MKKNIITYLATAILVFASFSSYSQDHDRSAPAWVSDKGYWVVETNIHQPLQYTIRFYNNENTIIGTKDISGKKMNMKRRRVKMQLKSMLEFSLAEWAVQNPATGNTGLAQKP